MLTRSRNKIFFLEILVFILIGIFLGFGLHEVYALPKPPVEAGVCKSYQRSLTEYICEKTGGFSSAWLSGGPPVAPISIDGESGDCVSECKHASGTPLLYKPEGGKEDWRCFGATEEKTCKIQNVNFGGEKTNIELNVKTGVATKAEPSCGVSLTCHLGRISDQIINIGATILDSVVRILAGLTDRRETGYDIGSPRCNRAAGEK